jgi:threonine aldolase
MAQIVDLRSDTFSLPTPEMYSALLEAPLGNDVYGEDPTVNELEALSAQLTGMEAAMLVSSGTQGNLCALLAHCSRGDEVILGETTDLFNYEVSGLSAVGGLMPRPVPDEAGFPATGDIANAIQPDDLHVGKTAVICVEDTHQHSGGLPIPMAQLEEIAALANARNIPIHMDGARVFNAALALDIAPAQITNLVTSVTFCLSKGLSCPIGSVLCGSEEFVNRARRVRKMLGGGMRQAGWIAAAGIVGLRDYPRMLQDHENAARLARGLSLIDGIAVNPDQVRTNIVYFDVAGTGIKGSDFVRRLSAAGVKAGSADGSRIRMVVYRNISQADVDLAIEACQRVANNQVVALESESSAASHVK